MSDDQPPSLRLSSHQPAAHKPKPLVLEGTETSSLPNSGDWSDKELWLIRAPKDFNPKLLHGQEIILNTDQQLDITNQDSSKTFNLKAQSSVTQNVSVLVPSSKPGRLKPGPCLQGSMCVQRSVDVPGVTLPPPHIDSKVERPQGLKQRWKPFGWKEPLSSEQSMAISKKSSQKKRKKRHSSDSMK